MRAASPSVLLLTLWHAQAPQLAGRSAGLQCSEPAAQASVGVGPRVGEALLGSGLEPTQRVCAALHSAHLQRSAGRLGASWLSSFWSRSWVAVRAVRAGGGAYRFAVEFDDISWLARVRADPQQFVGDGSPHAHAFIFIGFQNGVGARPNGALPAAVDLHICACAGRNKEQNHKIDLTTHACSGGDCLGRTWVDNGRLHAQWGTGLGLSDGNISILW